MKRTSAASLVLAAILLSGQGVHSQQPTLIQFGPAVTILDTTSVGALFGSSYALPGSAAHVLTWQLNPVGSPSAISATLQVSLDNTNWFSLTTCTSTAGCIYNVGVSSYKFVRTQHTSRTGGTSTNAVVTVARAYGINSGTSPTMSGNLLFSPDNTYDIGGASTNRPNDINAGGVITGVGFANAATSYYAWAGRSLLRSPADGTIKLSNSAETDFGLLQFGGTTSAFPALKRSGNGFHMRLADDSGYATLITSAIGLNVAAPSGGGLGMNATLFANLGTPANGTFFYCSDCTIASPCAGSGTGAFAKRLNGIWVCN